MVNRYKHGLCVSFLLVSVCLVAPNVLADYRGVVFIHGRGPAEYQYPGPATRYWGDLIRVSTRNYAIPSFVAHYDGTRNMRQSAKTVANQIAQFIKTYNLKRDELKIYAHSYGGVIARYIFSNADRSHAFRSVIDSTASVTTIGSPHQGSEAADTLYQWHKRGNWLQQWFARHFFDFNPSAMVLMTANMNYMSRTCILWGVDGCPPLPKPFYQVSGGHGSDLLNDFYNQGHIEDLALTILSYLVWFPERDDGLVAQYSAEALQGNAAVILRSKANHHHLRDNAYVPLGKYFSLELFLD